MPGNVIISTASIPEGFCPPWLTTEKWEQLVSLLSASLLGTLNTFNYGSSTPAPADEDKPWLKLTSDGYPDGQYWVNKGGVWLKQHPIVPGIVTMWEGDITTIDTFDGGEVATLSLTTGPMWERVSTMDGRFPLGIGTQITSGTPINVADSGGEETHLLVTNEIPEHAHVVFATSTLTEGGNDATRLAPSIAEQQSYGNTGNYGGDQPHNNMPPWSGIGFIRRTSRMYYRA